MENDFNRKVLDKKLEANINSCQNTLKRHREGIRRFLEINMGIQIENSPKIDYQTQQDNLFYILLEEFHDFNIYEYYRLLEITPLIEGLDLNYEEFQSLKFHMIDFINFERKKNERIINQIKEKLLKRNIQSISDVFGSYSYSRESFNGKLRPERIMINFLSCEFFAAEFKISLEDLVLSTYVHELTHYYSHVGLDKDKLNWINFDKVDSFVKEGIAQYYSFQYFKSIGKVESFDKIENLTDSIGNYIFGAEYREYLKYLHYSPEQMYFAFIQFRRNNCTKPNEFLHFLDKSKKELP